MNKFAKAAWLIAFLIGLLPSAFATAELRLSDGTTTTNIVDQSAEDSNPILGIIEFTGDVGPNWYINISIGVTKPVFGTVATPFMHLGTVGSSDDKGGLIVEFSETNFLASPGTVFAHIGGETEGTVAFETWLGAGNNVFEKSTLLTTSGLLGPGPFNNDASGVVLAATPYSLTLTATIGHLFAGDTRFDAQLNILSCPPEQVIQLCNPVRPTCADATALIQPDDVCVTATKQCIPGPVLTNGCSRRQTFNVVVLCENVTLIVCNVTFVWTEDNEPPGITCPPDRNLGCNPLVIPDCNASDATATDNCGTPVITCTSANGPTIGCTSSRTNIYVATDACGNTNVCRQVLTWTTDITPPEFTLCPPNRNLGCNPLVIPDCNASDATATDNCGTPVITCTSANGPTIGCTSSRTNIYVATDACGNTNVCRQVLTWTTDITPPEFTLCPPNRNLGCNPLVIPDCNASDATATDNCGTPVITCTSANGPTIGCTSSRTNIYVATDACGNTNVCRQVLTWTTDITPPEFTLCPPNRNLGCNPLVIPDCNASDATATDNCGTPVITCTSANGPTIGCTSSRTNIYVATDACGNTNVCRQVLTWTTDITPPEFTLCPPNRNLGCNPLVIPDCNASDATATDNCGTPVITCTSANGPTIGCTSSRTNIYVATDACGNTNVCRQVLTWTTDITPPEFTLCPPNRNLGCNPLVIPDCNASDATATDNCGTPVITCTSANGPTIGCTSSRTNIYVATDACGNTNVCRQVLTWTTDITPPEFTLCPPNRNLGCNPLVIPDCNASDATATDNCGTPVITCTSANGPTIGCTSSRTNIYVATDACGNTNVCRQVLTWTTDITPPEFTLCPPNRNLGCNPLVIPDCNASDATATDNCGTPVITCTSANGPTIGCTSSRTNIYVATDACGNTNVCRQVLTWTTDITPPEFTLCPPNRNLGCNPLVIPDCNASDATATDNCGTPVITCTSANGPTIGCTSSRTNIYVATDACGNTNVCRQVLTWTTDITPPEFTLCPPNRNLGCNPLVIPDCNASDATATDNCGTPVITCTSANGPTIGCTSSRTNIYVATDACGNTNVCRQVLTWTTDITPPEFTLCPPNRNLGCNPLVIPDCNASDATATDNCGTPVITCTSANGPTIGCTSSRTNIYVATDACGNTNVCRQVLTWTTDITPPVITCPPDFTEDHHNCKKNVCSKDHCSKDHCSRPNCERRNCDRSHCHTPNCSKDHCNQDDCGKQVCKKDHCSKDHCSRSNCSKRDCDRSHCDVPNCDRDHCNRDNCGKQVCKKDHCSKDHCSRSDCDKRDCDRSHCDIPNCDRDHCNRQTCGKPSCYKDHCSKDHCSRPDCNKRDCDRDHCHVPNCDKSHCSPGDCGKNYSKCGHLYCSFTQDDWGVPPSGYNIATILHNSFSSVYPAGFVEIGIPGAGGRSARFNTATAIQNYLPASGAPAVLPADLVNPITTPAGVFAGEVLSLQLNVDFTDAGAAIGVVGHYGDLVIALSGSDFEGLTVRQVLALANTKLGGGTVSVSVADLLEIVGKLNDAYSGCSPNLWGHNHLFCPEGAPPGDTGTATATDNCGPVNITYTDVIDHGDCGRKLVRRTWKATDACGNTATCEQLIGTKGIPSSICGSVLRDCDANGNLAGEAPLTNWTVTLITNSSGAVVASTTTGADGSYCFENLEPGTYTVVVTPQPGYVQTVDPDTTKDHKTTIVLAGCESKAGVKFGYRGNLPGVHLVKKGPATANCGDTITYTFAVTNTGNTCLYGGLHVDDPMFGGQIFAQSPVNPGQGFVFTRTYVVKSSDAPLLVNTATATGHPPTGPAVSVQSTWNVQITPCCVYSICGSVLRDCDANGSLSGEAGLGGWTVTLKDSSGTTTITSTTTGSDGSYCFNNLASGTYTVVVTPKNYYSQTSDPDGTKDHKTKVTLSGCQPKTGVKFGYTGTAPSVHLVKKGPATASRGETITYTFAVTNTGNTCLYGGMRVVDQMLGGEIWARTPVAPGEGFVFTKTYVVKSTDPSPLCNTATAFGHPPNLPAVSKSSTWNVTLSASGPTGVCAVPGNCKVTLTWNALSGASSYKIKRSTTSGGPYTTIKSGHTTTSYTDTGLVNGTVYYYVVSAIKSGTETGNSAQVAAVPSTVSTPWATKDIGAVAAVGGAGLVSGKHTISGSGADIWGTADEFRYVYMPSSGDCSIVAKVTGLANTDAWAKAGVMIRENLNANAKHVSFFITPGNGVACQSRANTGGASYNSNVPGPVAPYWIKLTRVGNTFTASYSSNGSSWTSVASPPTTMTSSAYIGFAVTSHNDGALCTADL